jgi:DNA (cytosine-5)-methyltransferase 1
MLDLFAGICGVSLAAEWAGIETVAFCEIEPFPQKVIRKHWPGVPIFEDVRKLNRQMLIDKGVIDDAGTRTIDIICAGYPCQPFSVAGNRGGAEDDRHLWPEVKRLLEELRPRWFVGENVAGHITLGLDNVLADLESIGYAWKTFVIPAAAIGAPHRRDRVFIVGNTEHNGHVTAAIRGSVDKAGIDDKERQNQASESPGTSRPGDDEALAYPTGIGQPGQREPFQSIYQAQTGQGKAGEPLNVCGREERSIEPGLGGMLNGLSDWMDGHRWPAGLGQPQHDWEPPRVASGVKNRVGRLKGLGNAVSPQQIFPLLYFIKQINDSLKEL